MAAQQRALVIFYLHLVLLGRISTFLLAYPIQARIFQKTRLLSMGLILFISGFLGSEALLLYQGLSGSLGWPLFNRYSLRLSSVSLALPVGFLLILFTLKQPTPERQPLN